jgi:DNA-binding FadR family transcriptional regulator
MRSVVSVGEAEEPARKAERLARIIATDIIDARMACGQQLGTMAELSQRYDAGAAAIRQAVILLEQQGLIELKRGQGGGASVLRSGAQAAAMALATHLDHLDLSMTDIFAARAYVEGVGAQWAAARATRAQGLDLRALADGAVPPGEDTISSRTQQIVHHAQRAMALSGNVLLEIFSDALRNITAGFAADPTQSDAFGATIDENARYRRALSDAILAGDGFAARTRAEDWHLSTVPRLVHAGLHMGGDEAVPPSMLGRAGLEREMNVLRIFFGRKGRTAEALVRLIAREIRVRRLAPEARLGSENELLAYYGVARPALRQALRLLERHGMVATRQGKAGGIFVGRADPAAALLAFRDHAQSLALSPRTVGEARDALLAPLVQGLIARGAGALPTDPVGLDLPDLAQAAGVAIWPLLARSIAMLAGPTDVLFTPVSRALVDAIRASDAALARRLARDDHGGGAAGPASGYPARRSE